MPRIRTPESCFGGVAQRCLGNPYSDLHDGPREREAKVIAWSPYAIQAPPGATSERQLPSRALSFYPELAIMDEPTAPAMGEIERVLELIFASANAGTSA